MEAFKAMEQEHVGQSGSTDNGNDTQSKRNKYNSIMISFWSFVLVAAGLVLIVPGYISDRSEAAKVVIESIFSLAIVIIVIGQTHINARQARALDVQEEIFHKQSEIMGHALRIQTQPYVCVHSITLDHSQYTIYIEVENLGTVPADSIQMDLWFKLERPPDLNLAHQERLEWGRKTELYRGNLRLSSRFRLDTWLNTNQFTLITMGQALLTVEGLITFYDGFLPRDPRYTHVAFEYRLAQKRWFPRRIWSPEELEAEKAEDQLSAQNPN
jgi:hypothetical protein